MKSLRLFVCLFLALGVSHHSFGQFNKGRWLAGGSVSLSANSGNNGGSSSSLKWRTTNFNIGPQAGYFIMDYLAVGASLSLVMSAGRGESYDPATGAVVDAKSNGTSIALGPFVRYYLPSSIFFQAKVNFGSGKNKYTVGSTTTEANTSQFDWGLACGYAYFLNDYVAIEPTLGYQSNGSSINDSDYRTGNLYLNAAFTIYLGERK